MNHLGIALDVINQIKRGAYVRVQLVNGPEIRGFAGTDPEFAELIRLDSLIEEVDGELAQVSLRLHVDELETAEVLPNPPQFVVSGGQPVSMPASFWSE